MSTVTRRSFLATSVLATAGPGADPPRRGAQSVDKLTFGTNWKAQAEHGGYYQAVATGIYKKLRSRRDDPDGRTADQPSAAPGLGRDRLQHGRQLLQRAELREEQHPDGVRRHRLPEGSAGAHRPRRPGQRFARGHEGQADHDLAGGAAGMLAVPAREVRLQRRPDPDRTPSTWRRSSPTNRRSSRAS